MLTATRSYVVRCSVTAIGYSLNLWLGLAYVYDIIFSLKQKRVILYSQN